MALIPECVSLPAEHRRPLRRSQSHSELSATKSSLDAAVDAAIDAAMMTNRTSEPQNMDTHAHLTLPNDETRTSFPTKHKVQTASGRHASILPIGRHTKSQRQLGSSDSLNQTSKSSAAEAPESNQAALLPPKAPPMTQQSETSTLPLAKARCKSLEEPETPQHNSDAADAAPLIKRGRTLPNQGIKRSDMSALQQPPDRLPSQLSTLKTLQQAGSLSRRASLASKLLQMSLAGACRASFTESEFESRSSSATIKGPVDAPAHSFIADASLAPSATVPPAKAAQLIAAVVSPESQQDTLAAALSMPANSSGDTQRLSSDEINRKAAEVRLQRLLNGVNPEHPSKKISSPWPSKASRLTVASDSLHDSGDTLQTADDASQSGQRRALQRTLSDVALQALEAVENMKCNIIPYNDLQIKRKIGDGAIGQVPE